MALSKAVRTIVSSQSNAAGATTRGTIDLEAGYGGLLTLKITNGATGPSVQCTANVLIAHNASLSAAGSRGADWKTIASYGGGTAAGAMTEIPLPVDPLVGALEVEFTGHTGQGCCGDAWLRALA